MEQAYTTNYTFVASLCLLTDGLSLFSHRQQEVLPHYILTFRMER